MVSNLQQVTKTTRKSNFIKTILVFSIAFGISVSKPIKENISHNIESVNKVIKELFAEADLQVEKMKNAFKAGLYQLSLNVRKQKTKLVKRKRMN